MMYAIYLQADGKYHCEGRLQDSTERWTRDTLAEAVESMKSHALHGNGVKIKRRDIHYFESQQVVKTEWVEKPIPKLRG